SCSTFLWSPRMLSYTHRWRLLLFSASSSDIFLRPPFRNRRHVLQHVNPVADSVADSVAGIVSVGLVHGFTCRPHAQVFQCLVAYQPFSLCWGLPDHRDRGALRV